MGGPDREQLLVRYDRLTAGRLAWLRITAADVPPSTPLTACLSTPAEGWQPEAEMESLEVGGLPAARVAFRGPWEGQEYLNESAAVRKGERVYLFTASFPAADAAAREQVRKAIAAAAWRQGR
jgi:hypothetical protein